METKRFDFSNLSKVKDGLKGNLLHEMEGKDKMALDDDTLDYAVAAGNVNYLLKNKTDGCFTAEESELLREYLNMENIAVWHKSFYSK